MPTARCLDGVTLYFHLLLTTPITPAQGPADIEQKAEGKGHTGHWVFLECCIRMQPGQA